MAPELLVSIKNTDRQPARGPHHYCSLHHSQPITYILVKQPVQHVLFCFPHETFRGFLNTSGFVSASSSLFKRSDYFHVSWQPGLQLKSEKAWLSTNHGINALVVCATTCWQVAILNTWAWIVRDTGSLLRRCLQFSWCSEHLWWSQSHYLGALIAWCVNHVCLRT